MSDLAATYTGLYSGLAEGTSFVSLTADGQPAMSGAYRRGPDLFFTVEALRA